VLPMSVDPRRCARPDTRFQRCRALYRGLTHAALSRRMAP